MLARNTNSVETFQFLDDLEIWVRNTLPLLNNRIEAHQQSPTDLIVALQPWIKKAKDHLATGEPNRADARRALQLLGFCVGSVERHLQSQHCVPGEGVAQLSPLDTIVSHLASLADHPPRDSHYTYWLWNTNPKPLTFTGNPQEMFFNKVVNFTNEAFIGICDALRPVAVGTLPVAGACDALEFAAAQMAAVHEQFKSFMYRSAPDGQRNMEPMFFMLQMRTYLPTYPIQGVDWAGVNAANLTSQMQLDYLIGTVLPDYSDVIQGRMRYLTSEDRKALEADMVLPSFTVRLMEQLGFDEPTVEASTENSLAGQMASHPLSSVYRAYAKLVETVGHASAMHRALIRNYLEVPAEKLDEAQREAMAVDPSQGTGGKKHSDTEKIMQMRREHPVAAKLARSIHLIT